MPPSPVVATDRLVFRYTVGSFTHKQVAYFLGVASGDVSGFDAVSRPGGTNVPVSGLDAAFFTAIAPFYDPANTVFDTMTFEQRLGSLWIPVYVKATAVAPTGTGAIGKATGADVVGKDLAHKTIHAYIYEGHFGPSEKTQSVGGLDVNALALVNYYYQLTVFTSFFAAWWWRRAKTSSYAQNWLSLVTDSNQKLRRMRRIA